MTTHRQGHLWLVCGWLVLSCATNTPLRKPRPATISIESSNAPPAQTQLPTGRPASAGVSCSNGVQCVLAADLYCCGRCYPAMPPRATSQAAEAERRNAELGHCVIEDHDCSTFSCPPKPAGCRAKAICTAGRCEVWTNGSC